jgi:hypothetical protein
MRVVQWRLPRRPAAFLRWKQAKSGATHEAPLQPTSPRCASAGRSHDQWRTSARIGSAIEARSKRIPLPRACPHATHEPRLRRYHARQWGRRSCQVRPAYGVAGPNLRRPPTQRISRKHSRSKKRPLQPGIFDYPLDVLGQVAHRIRLLEKGVCCFEWGGKEDDPLCLLRDPLHSGTDELGWGSPHQKHCVHILQRSIQGFRNPEISPHDLNLYR